ncbi:Uncharacterised protein [Agrobacterium tumefaciens]|nr:Uncharacterised protein [Agrobacterium tumefaciens]
MPSNNMLFNLVHNPGEISATVIEKPGQFFVRANIVVSTNNAIAPEMILAFFSCIAQNPNNFRGADKPHKPEKPGKAD